MFNLEEHKERQRIINHGRQKWPDEKNITKLYQMACKDLGIEFKTVSTKTADHLPTPEESTKARPELAQICPKCGKRSYILTGLCGNCKDAEGGKYRTMLKCYECQHQEKSEEPLVVWLERLGIDFQTQTKASLGIKTMTDEGLK